MDSPLTFEELLEMMDRLRGPGGCPWDREQTYETLRSYLLEESYEVVDALDRKDDDGLREELGDLLFQIVFLSRLAKEEGKFTAHEVVRGIGEKMIRRHPHVFAQERADTSEEVLRNWERIKRGEKEDPASGADPASVLSGIPVALPALLKAQRLGTKAARVGFDWAGPTEVFEKVEEELGELRRAIHSGESRAAREELGDVMFSLAMLARHLGVDPEIALEATNTKFRARFEEMETQLRRRGVKPEEAGMELLEDLWSRSKDARRPPPA